MQDEFYFFMIYSGFAGGSRSGGFVGSILDPILYGVKTKLLIFEILFVIVPIFNEISIKSEVQTLNFLFKSYVLKNGFNMS